LFWILKRFITIFVAPHPPSQTVGATG